MSCVVPAETLVLAMPGTTLRLQVAGIGQLRIIVGVLCCWCPHRAFGRWLPRAAMSLGFCCCGEITPTYAATLLKSGSERDVVRGEIVLGLLYVPFLTTADSDRARSALAGRYFRFMIRCLNNARSA